MGYWCLVGCAVVIVGEAVGCGLYFRRRKGGLTIKILDIATLPTGRERGDWFVRLTAALENHSSDTISVEGVTFQAVSPDGRRLVPNEVCGDRRKALERRRHPPRLTMRLPIFVPADGGVEYTFDVFFDRNLRSYWHSGNLQMVAGLQPGTAFSVETNLRPPE